MSVIGTIAAEFGLRALGKVFTDGDTYNKVQNVVGITSLASAFAVAAATAVPAVAAAALGSSTAVTLAVAGAGAMLGASCLPLAIAAGVVWGGMALLKATGLREAMGDTVGGRSAAPALAMG